jgi:hypothetical protein
MESPIGNAAAIGAFYGAIQQLWKVPAEGAAGASSLVNPAKLGEAAVKNSFHFMAMGLIYTIGSDAAASFRHSDDHFNGAIGGAAVGAYTGLRQGGVSAMHGMVHRSLILGGIGMFCSFVGTKLNKKN